MVWGNVRAGGGSPRDGAPAGHTQAPEPEPSAAAAAGAAAPAKARFRFIELFAGIGGFRLALQVCAGGRGGTRPVVLGAG